MGKRLCWLALLLPAIPAPSVYAGDAPPKQAGEVTLRGRLSVKPDKAQDGVAALLTVVARKGERAEVEKAIRLFAEGELAKRLADMAQQKAKVYVTGLVRPDGMDVIKVVEKTAVGRKPDAPPPRESKEQPRADDDF